MSRLMLLTLLMPTAAMLGYEKPHSRGRLPVVGNIYTDKDDGDSGGSDEMAMMKMQIMMMMVMMIMILLMIVTPMVLCAIALRLTML